MTDSSGTVDDDDVKSLGPEKSMTLMSKTRSSCCFCSPAGALLLRSAFSLSLAEVGMYPTTLASAYYDVKYCIAARCAGFSSTAMSAITSSCSPMPCHIGSRKIRIFYLFAKTAVLSKRRC